MSTDAQPQMATTANESRVGIALCLSGGGFRAALFHLGALRRLNELGILENVSQLSTVSGGSILAGHLAQQMSRVTARRGLAFHDWQNDVAAPFHEFVKRDLRTIPVLAHLAWNWIWPRFRVRQMERRYHKRLCQLPMSGLPDSPEFLMCATDLTFGVNWVFSKQRVGDFQAGYVKDGGKWPIARAIAASACFPPVFGPIYPRVSPKDFIGGNFRGAGRDRLLSEIALSDGGVYDNMGLEPVWNKARWVLVSDCGSPFDFAIGRSPLRRLLRYTSVIMNQTRALRLRKLVGDWKEKAESRRYDGAYWNIAWEFTSRGRQKLPDGFGYSSDLVSEVIAQIRTDLDEFSEAECCVLENHGYFAADYAVRTRLPQLVAAGNAAPVAPHADWMDEAIVREALRSSHRVFSPSRLLWSLLRFNV